MRFSSCIHCWVLLVSVFMLPLLPASAVDKPFKIVSLMSICQNSTHQDNFGLSLHYAITYGLNENFQAGVDYDYEKFDICRDRAQLLETVLKLIVDVKYENIVERAQKSRILCIFLYLPTDETVLAANIFSAFSVPVISFKNNSCENRVFNKNYLEHYNIPQETSEYLLHFVGLHHYDYVIAFSLNQTHGTHARYQKFVDLAQQRVCISSIMTDVDGAVERTLTTVNKNAYAFFIFGDVAATHKYSVHIYDNHTDVDTHGSKVPLIYSIFEVETEGIFHKKATEHLIRLLRTSGENPDKSVIPGVYNGSYLLIHFEVLFNELKEYIDIGLTDDLLRVFKDDVYATRIGESKCTNFKCDPGFERRLVNTLDTRYNSNNRYRCAQCQSNYVQSDTSEKQCTPCVGKNISNAPRTQCFVPYKLQMFDFRAPENVIGLMLNLFGLFYSVLVFFVFELYKTTPIVRSSDRILSQIQTASGFTMFLFLLMYAFLRANIKTCVLLPMFIGVAFSVFVAVTLAKVEKPLLVFRDRKQLTQRDINRTITHQYFIITLVPLTSIMLAVIHYRYNPSQIMTLFDDVTVKKSVTCNTDGHLHIQIIFIIFLSLVTLIQSYRVRKLPDNYSESMTILYSSLSAAVFLGILFPLYYSQGSQYGRMHMQWIILSFVGLIMALSMYVRKLFIIVFYPEKNTMKAWNRKRLQYHMEESMSCLSGPAESEETFV